ncbi:Hydroxypyruvate isomerase [Crateriforma conspicua]|uniref:Hydroxypyruvate isomerase n=1 Tax=Crateriforma conspicua TaxID=2527996 RepID=A0A5C6G0R8_9PLAN|nr:TIM barrel protein [Crateriforma conspicua]TWU67080.1 Hydroxypyruvate isomerase [Crateriforma conspicua]
MTGKLKPSVCIDAVFGDLSVTDAVKRVHDTGIDAFEFWGWWDKDLAEIKRARDDHNMAISACCTKFVSLVDPAVRSDYLNGLEESIAAAKDLDCHTLISQVGDFRKGVPRAEQHDALVDGLTAAAALLEGTDITLVIEPLNELVDHAGYYLIHSDEAFQIVDKVNSPNVRVVFDIYHQQISEGHLIERITSGIDRIGHFHAAGNPGRHELDRGEIHYPSVFAAIAETNYQGYVGLEYWPVEPAEVGLNRIKTWFE